MHYLYPSDPFDKKSPDEDYREEYEAAIAGGLTCCLFSPEDFEAGEFQPRPALDAGATVLYRGWMLTLDKYSKLCDAIRAKGATPFTSPEAYAHCHYLPNWYALCRDITPQTLFLSRDADFVEALSGLEWPGYFVKDYVKSLTTSRGSLANTPVEIADIVDQIENYRGQIEGGVCVRQFENFVLDTEERFFVLLGQAYGSTQVVPDIVHRIARVIKSPFFSADIVTSTDGALRLVELGDGQVSDRKQWPADRFVQMLCGG
ncbi:MAG: ATP-grasp domain-containing protein [Pseudoxanthomonas sp.]